MPVRKLTRIFEQKSRLLQATDPRMIRRPLANTQPQPCVVMGKYTASTLCGYGRAHAVCTLGDLYTCLHTSLHTYVYTHVHSHVCACVYTHVYDQMAPVWPWMATCTCLCACSIQLAVNHPCLKTVLCAHLCTFPALSHAVRTRLMCLWPTWLWPT